jgi:signal transduction histidine kinase
MAGEETLMILMCLVACVAAGAFGVGLYVARRDDRSDLAVQALPVIVLSMCASVLFVAGCALAQWSGAASFRAPLVALLEFLAAALAIGLLLWRRRLTDLLSSRPLRDANQALRLQIDTLQHHAAVQIRNEKMTALSLFSAGVSHYINNIAQVTGGALALLAPRVAGDAQAEELIALALAATDRSVRLTNQLLLFAQEPALIARHVDIQAFINTLRIDLAGQLPPGIRLELADWCEETPIPLLIDTSEMMQVVSNLVANAQEAMGETGTLTIELASCYMRERLNLADGYYLQLTVSDTGKGLAPHLAHHALDPFVSAKPTGLAAGLGLSVVYGISRRAGGTTILESRPGGGTSAIVYFRLAQDENGSVAAIGPDFETATSATHDFGGLRIMLVDDEPETRTIVALTLESLGCEVVQADSGAQALLLAEQFSPDLFVLDFAMPGMNGAELACALRARNGQSRIAFLTGFADRVAIEAALGPDVALVYKPASRPQLAQVIANALAA